MSTNIVVPELGESIVEARVGKWLKKEGDRVAMGDPLVELETEKIDLEVSADRVGVLSRIQHKEGDDVKVGEVLGVLEAGSGGAESAAPGRADGVPPPESRTDAAEVRATPTARNIAREQGVKLESIAPSSGAERVTKQDVLRASAPSIRLVEGRTGDSGASADAARSGSAEPRSRTTAPAPRAPSLPEEPRAEERTRMTKRRQTIARRLVEAQHNAAMLTTFNEIDMSEVMSLRERRKEAFLKQYGVGMGIASFFVKAAIAALKAFPLLNAEIQGDEIVRKRYYDIGIAVGAEGGLVVPVIRDADKIRFAEIELAIRDFAKRANEGTLTLDDLKGGTFTITNGGVFGSLMSTPILNPPQVGILGLHKIADRPVAVNGQVVIRPMMYVALSYDHRIVDGREAVQFLVKVKEYVEDPAWLLVS